MAPDRLSRLFARLARWRRAIVAIYVLLVPAAVLVAMRIPTHGEIEQLIVPGDPDLAATRAFEKIFPEPQLVLLVLELDDPWTSEALDRVARAERAIATVPHVSAFSAIDAIRHAHPGADPATVRRLALGTDFFRHQGLVGDRFLTVIASLDVHDATARDAALAGIDHELDRAQIGLVHEVGGPVVTSWLEHESSTATGHSFALFGVLLVAVTWFLYRSWRALSAIVIALGTSVALAVAVGDLLGFAFTIVSALVPLTVMVTTMATLTYLHSRFVDQPSDLPLAEHQVAALRNKFLPVTASTIATATGFAALAVSDIRPIREMGLWTAAGIVIAWLVSFTLFPALQLVLRTPTGQRVAVRSALYERIAIALPARTYRHRRGLVAIAFAGCAAGVVAITGIPGVWRGAAIQIDVLSNVGSDTRLHRDLVWFREHVMDLNIARVWIHLPSATATDPTVLRAIDELQTALATIPGATGVTGPTTPLRMRSYFAGHGDALPTEPAAFADAVGDFEELILTEPDVRTFIDVSGLRDVQLAVLFRDGDATGYTAMSSRIRARWNAIAARSPALAGAKMDVVGESLVQVKVGASLVPTLAESLALTVGCILVVFLVVFRSGTERLLAMIPSLFALLVTFFGMRVLGGSLNIATILVTTTVLGSTENDQLHFFHHMHEVDGGLEQRLRHTLRVSGRAIAFATLVNSVGFLALATSSFPPLRQFGLMMAGAFALAMIADFTILPAALWLVARDRPLQG